MRGGKSITSGSPMSPGSFVSSESAGSSNSLDETDDNRIVTPIDDHMGPATIFEVRPYTLESGINIRVRLFFFGSFSRGYVY